ncbi:response regulator [Litoribacter alkaliphilus]|uniref:Sensory/regulatory protein RpfC n=1 Tax=Litoribacter ruber TaxID=702568 RepID=A0AAP2CI22_9BACT|nr:response regulator [Litoribacter alkaliphilus]MBS9525088.1 response regulator [Litoribacter alkaliphilus]
MTHNNINETERLETLKSYDVLDSHSESEFDRLTTIASLTCQTPMAVISLIGENKQIFRSTVGVEIKETDIQCIFCLECIKQKELVISEDASKDERFKDNSLVTGPPHIRFYTGVPLLSPEGHVLGTLSVMDDKPNSLDDNQIKVLKLLAQQVITAILDNRKRKQLQQYEALFKSSLDIMTIVDKDGKNQIINQAYMDITGWDEEKIKTKGETIVHPDDVPRAYKEYEKILKGKKTINYLQRTLTKSGEYKTIQWHANKNPETGDVVAVGRDVTEDLKTKAELQQQKDFLNSIVEGMLEGFAMADRSGKKVRVNKALCQMTGFSEEELLGQTPPYSYWPKDMQKKNSYYFTKAIKGELDENVFELVYQKKNGERFPVLVNTSVIQDPSTKEKFVFATVQNISATKRTEQKLLVTQKMMEQTNRVAHVGGWDVDLETNTTYWSDITREIHEVPDDFNVTLEAGLNFYRPGRSLETIKEHWKKAEEEGVPFDLELEIITYKGKYKWIRTKCQCEKLHGKVTRIYGTFQDITGKKKSEFEIENKEKMLKGISLATDQLLSNRKFEDAIERSLKILGQTVEVGRVYLFENSKNENGELVASQTFEYAADDCSPQFENQDLQDIYHKDFEDFFQPLSQNKVFLAKISDIQDKPQLKEFLDMQEIKSILVIPIFYSDNFWGFIGYDECYEERDWSDAEISLLKSFAKTIANAIERKNMDLSMERAIDQAKSANIAKSEFLANMSHEIRTPLNGIIGFTDLVMKTNLDPTQSQYLGIVNNSANALLSIINDILDFSKIEAGKLELDIERFDVYEMASQTADIISYQAQSKYLEMLLNISLDVPRFIHTDEVRIRQVLINLLSNAVKFTEVGEVELKIEVIEYQDEECVLRFLVRDTGIGIKREMQEKIFEAFSQEDGSTTKKYGGTGLGLAISNQLLGLMSSHLNLESEHGKGSTFYFDLRVKADQGESIEFEEVENIQKALVVDDNDNNRTIIHEMLRLKGIDIEEASSGYEALQMMGTRNDFDVILMDYHMPYMDGLETIRKIRSNFGTQADEQPIILLYSSSDDERVIRECEELHVTQRLVKPIKMHDLYNSLAKLHKSDVKKKKEIEESTAEASFESKYNVLIAEDNQINMFLAKTIIQRILPNSTIFEAPNGQIAFELYKTKQPDLIILDIQMPIMNGYEVTEAIRKAESGTRTPILALTAGNVKGEKEKCLNIGMDDFIAKPVVEETLEMALHKWLPLNKDKKEEPEQVTETEDMNSERFDIKVLEGYVKNNPDLMQAFMDITIKELENAKVELNESLSLQNLADINSAGHKLKGTASSAGLNWLFEIGLELEGLDEFDYRKIKILITKAQNEIDEVLTLLKAKKEE